MLASDEAYCEIYFGDRPPSALQLADHSGVLAFHTLSKRSSMPGHRSGFVAGDPALVALLRRFRPSLGTVPQAFVQRASVAAWDEESHVDEARARTPPSATHCCPPCRPPVWSTSAATRRSSCGCGCPTATTRAWPRGGWSTASWRPPGPTSGRAARAHLRLALVPTVEACERAAELVARLGHDPAPGHGTDLVALASHIEELYEKPTSDLTEEDAATVAHVIDLLDDGVIRVAAPTTPGAPWKVNEWAKKAVLLTFRTRGMETSSAGPTSTTTSCCSRPATPRAGSASCLPATARHGSYLAPGVVLMPSYVNIGAWVGENTMVDTWATVGSCAQIGADVHLSGGVGIGGVLEPLQAAPVIVEDGAFVGSRCIVVEGVRVGARAVLGANVVLTATTPIIDMRGKKKVEMRGEVPAGAIVVPGTRTKKLPAGKARLPCAYIIGERSTRTDLKTSLNDALREHAVSV